MSLLAGARVHGMQQVSPCACAHVYRVCCMLLLLARGMALLAVPDRKLLLCLAASAPPHDGDPRDEAERDEAEVEIEGRAW